MGIFVSSYAVLRPQEAEPVPRGGFIWWELTNPRILGYC